MFAYKPAKAGSVVTVVDTVTADMVIDAGSQKIQYRSTTEKKYAIKTLEVKDSVTKVEVKYASVVETQATGGKSDQKPHPESGKTYQVSSDGAGALVVTGAKGVAVSDEERKAVVEDFDQEVGVTPRMARVVAGKNWKMGEKVTLTKEDLAILNEVKDKPIGTAGTITLVAMNKKTAVFAVELSAGLKNQVLDLQLPDLRLEATVDIATLRAQALKMSGSMKGTAQTLPVTGTIAGVKTIKGK
jgi:hypothetical protein